MGGTLDEQCRYSRAKRMAGQGGASQLYSAGDHRGNDLPECGIQGNYSGMGRTGLENHKAFHQNRSDHAIRYRALQKSEQLPLS